MRRPALLGTLVTVALTWIAPAAYPQTQRAAGAIEGRVIFDGRPPPPTIVIQEEGSQEVLYVARSGGLRYAVVFLQDGRPSGRSPEKTATMNQRNFIFEPQVLAVRAGQLVRFTSDDPANHNVRSRDANPANAFNIATSSGSVGPDSHRFASMKAGRPVELSCDIHPWMAAWVYVFDHGQFAVTEADGSFRIDNVPAGHYRLAVRQPSGRLTKDLEVDVRGGGTTHMNVRFTPSDIGMPSR
jgi:plastocyanin